MAKKIIVIDDDLYIRELYEEILKSEGYDVDTAEDGQKALEKLKNGGYDLILLDIMMPKLDGFEIMTQLCANDPKPQNGPILLLTNLDHAPLIKEGMEKGASAFLIKADITPKDLIEEVKKYIQ